MKTSLIVALFLSLKSMAQVEIIGTNFSGSGCPQGSARFVVAPDLTSFTILYDQFQVLMAPGSGPIAESQCRAEIEFKKPQNLIFEIENVDLRGFVQLEANMFGAQMVKAVTGIHRGRQGRTRDFAFERWMGPISKNYTLSTLPASSDQGQSNCLASPTSKIIIGSRIRIRSQQRGNGGGQGQISVDSADGKMVQKFNVKWRQCP
jgi:Domain of unknown function (DUF4360)